MKKSWGLTEKILHGQKIIESRWLKVRCAPWGRVKVDDIIYFKNSGEDVKIKTKVIKVLEFTDLNSKKVRDILGKYGRDDGIEDDQIEKFSEMFKDKRYCMLIFLSHAQSIPHFNISKKGFGMQASWISISNVESIKL